MGGVAQNLMSWHKLYRPNLQKEHIRQGTPGSMATLSPVGGASEEGNMERDTCTEMSHSVYQGRDAFALE